jgi:hypothetical protein
LFGDNEGREVAVEIKAEEGDLAVGSSVEVAAESLVPGSTIRVTVYSEPQVILEAKADADGRFTGGTELPDLPPGQHTLILEGQGASGELSLAGVFAVNDEGDLGRIVQPAVVTGLSGPDDPRLERAFETGLPVWDVAARPLTTAGVVVAATAVVALAGAGGLARSLNTTNSTASMAASDSERRRSSRGKLTGVVTKKLKGLQIESSAWGDLSGMWARAGTSKVDDLGRTLPIKAGRWSALVPRVLVDGAWLRAMLGSFGLVTWLVGFGLAVASIILSPSTALTPSLVFILAIVALSCLDSAGGAIAWLTLALWAAVTGQITSWPELFTALGLAVLLLSVPLLAHVIRPLRRLVSDNRNEMWERVFDYVMMPVFVAFAAGSMAKALNGLSGLEVMTPEAIVAVRWTVVIGIVVRLAGEDIARHWFPQRMIAVQPAKLVSPGRMASAGAIVIRSVLFLLVAEPFFGFTWLTVTAAVLLAVPQVLKLWEDDLPNVPALNKWVPRGLFRFLCLLLVGSFLTAWLVGDGGDEAVRASIVWLLIPGVLFGIIELFGRFGGDWPNVTVRRTLGVFVWLGAAGIVTGLLAPFA